MPSHGFRSVPTRQTEARLTGLTKFTWTKSRELGSLEMKLCQVVPKDQKSLARVASLDVV